MNKIGTTLISMAFLLAAPIVSACDYPSRPDNLPDGSTASKDQMLEGVKTINSYQEAMASYLECIEADQVVALQALDESDEDAVTQSKDMFNKKYNAAVDEQTLSVEEFNMQIRAYKANAE